MRVNFFNRSMDSQVRAGALVVRPVVSMPSYIGLRRNRLNDGSPWHEEHCLVSRLVMRRWVSVLRPDGKSTVITKTGQPADSARLTSFSVASQRLVA